MQLIWDTLKSMLNNIPAITEVMYHYTTYFTKVSSRNTLVRKKKSQLLLRYGHATPHNINLSFQCI